MDKFPEKVRTARKVQRLNQEQLGLRIGVSARTIASYEGGTSFPRGKKLRKLAEELNVTVEYLINDESDNPNEGRSVEERVEHIRQVFGGKGAREMADLLQRNTALFAGGDLDQDAKDAFFDALMTAYVTCKEEARRKYGRKGPEDLPNHE